MKNVLWILILMAQPCLAQPYNLRCFDRESTQYLFTLKGELHDMGTHSVQGMGMPQRAQAVVRKTGRSEHTDAYSFYIFDEGSASQDRLGVGTFIFTPSKGTAEGTFRKPEGFSQALFCSSVSTY